MVLKGGGGGGASQGDIRASGATFTFRADDMVSPAADKLKAKLTGFGKWAQGFGQGLSGSLLFGGAAGMGMAAATKLFGPMMDKMKSNLDDVVFGTRRLEEAARAAADEYASIAADAAKISRLGLARAGKTANPHEAARELRKEMADLEAKAIGLSSAATHAYGWATSYGPEGGAGVRKFLGIGDKQREESMKEFESARDALNKVREQQASIAERIAELSTPEALAKFRAPLDDLSQQIKDATDPALQAMGQYERAAVMLARNSDLSPFYSKELAAARERGAAADLALKNLPGGGSILATMMQTAISGGAGALPGLADMRERARGLVAGFDAVKGSFGGRSADLSFGLGNVAKQQTDLLREIAGSTESAANATVALSDALKMQ